MMEFWPENKGQSHLYAKFGTSPGINCTHIYHDRHRACHYPYGEPRDQGRESSYRTIPGSRTEALQAYTVWTDPELCAPALSHFPFILDRHTQQHQDPGKYQPHEATATQQTAREYKREFLREGRQSRWEPPSPVCYNIKVSTKKTNSSYRELEAWAARYSHSLPRRRHVEAELRGASQGLLESGRALEREGRSGPDSQRIALQHLRQSANLSESGVWDRGGRLQTRTCYPTQAPASDKSHMLDMKEKTRYQRRMFSHPPGYIAPPPYNSPHRSSPVVHHTSWEQEGKRQAYWSQLTLRKQDVSVHPQDKKKGEKKACTKPDGNKTCTELGGLEHKRRETDAIQPRGPISIQNTHMQCEYMLSLQQPQVIQAVENTKMNKQTSSKIIEGREFRLNKKAGGMTVFCLVSRIAGITETPFLPRCPSQRSIKNTELEGDSKGLLGSNDNHMKIADEVDFKALVLTKQSNTSDVRNLKTKQEETGVVSSGKNNLNYTDSTSGRQAAESAQPGGIRYPLWKEPSFTSTAETKYSSTCCLKVNNEELKSGDPHSQKDGSKVHPVDVKVRRLDIKKDTESEDCKGLLVIDTTCVVVKMELIPSPEKEHVQYLASTALTEHSALDIPSTTSPESNNQNDQNSETHPFHIKVEDLDHTEKRAAEKKSEMSSTCIPSSASGTLEEHGERVQGIPLFECVTEQQPEDATSFLDLHVEEQDEEVESSPIKNVIHDAIRKKPRNTTQEKQSQNYFNDGQTEDGVRLKDDDAKEAVTNEDGEDFAGSYKQEFNISEEDIDSQLKPNIRMSQKTTSLPESPSEEGTSRPVENDSSSQPSKDISNSSLLCDLTALSYISVSNTSPLSSPPPDLDLIDPTVEAMSAVILCTKDQNEQQKTSQLTENQISNAFDCCTKDMTGELVSQQQPGNSQPDNDTSVEECNVTDEEPSKEADRDPVDHLEQTLETAKENVIDIKILQLQLKYVKAEDVACIQESYMTEEQLEKDVTSPAALLEASVSKESVTDNQTQIEVKLLQTFRQVEEASCVNGSYMTEELSQIDASEDPAGLLEQTIPQEIILTETETLQDTAPRTALDVLSPSELHSPPHESDREPVSLSEMDSVCPPSLNPDAADSLPPPLHLDFSEESLQSSPSFPSASPPHLPPSFTRPPQEGGGSVSLDLAHREVPQYPRSLWDAVIRIRKHTAPDSENEEEEVSELWDPENFTEDLGCPDVVVDMNSGKMVFDEEEEHVISTETSVEDVEGGQIWQDPWHEEPSRCAEEGTPSCSSSCSHSSVGTVTGTEEDTGSKTEPDEGLHMTGGKRCCSVEMRGEDMRRVVQQDEKDSNEFCLSVECTVEAVGVREMEKQENEEDNFTPSEVTGLR